MSQSLPYHESFNGSNGSSWSNAWAIPSPEGLLGGTADVAAGRGRITMTSDWSNGTPQFSARLAVDNSSTFDLTFTLDFTNIEDALGGFDSGFWFHVKLQDPALGVDYYEIYYDPFNEGVVQAAIYKWVDGGFADTTHTGGYVDLPLISPSQAISIRILESGTNRSFKVWQGAEPGSWTRSDSAAPVHTGPRFIDFSTFAQATKAVAIYVDEIGVNDPAPVTQPLPYYEPFNYADGNSWALAVPNTSGWAIPGPYGMSGGTADVQGTQGAIHLTPNWVSGVPMFNGRLLTDDAPTYDLRFTINTAEVAPLMSDRGASCYFYVQLEDAAAGVIQYELSYDYDYDEDEGVNHATPRLRARMNAYGSGRFVTGAGHTLTLNTAAPILVRIVESGTDRSMKVWQGIEPDLWTILGTAPAHTGERFIDLSVYSIENDNATIYLNEIGVNSVAANLDGVTWVSVGATQHFEFFYDSALGPVNGGADALAAMANAEADLQNHFRWWGNTAPWTNGPELLGIRLLLPAHNPAEGAGAFYDRSLESIFFIWNKDDPNSSNYCSINAGWRGEFVHELGHHFQRLGGDRWGGASSMVEAQATFLDREFRRQIGDMGDLVAPGYGDGVTLWIQAEPWTRADYVNHVGLNWSSDENSEFYQALGCELLFFNYLRWHRGYSPTAITRAAAPTLRKAYENLTGDNTDPFPRFLEEIDAAFPRGQHFSIAPLWYLAWQSKDIANPYPLPGSVGIAVPGGGAGAAFVNGLPMTAQALKQFIKRR